MSAALKPKTPPTLPQAREILAEHERALLEARRANAHARSTLHLFKAAGDEPGESRCRRTIRETAATIEALEEEVASDEKTVETLIARETEAGNAKRYRALEALADKAVRASRALESLTIQWAGARAEAHANATEFESALVNCGVTFDAFLSCATRLDGRVEMALWAETDGQFGRSRTLDTPQQLKQSGLASVHKAATDFRAITLRDARFKLGFSGEA